MSLDQEQLGTANITLSLALHARHPETAAHSARVQNLSLELGRELNLSSLDLFNLKSGALLHDVGKLRTPDAILDKPGPLTAEEWDAMRHHPVQGADLLRALNFPQPIIEIVEYHHERFDGTGYPRRLDRYDIPVGARIVAIADAYDAMTERRPYRPQLRTPESVWYELAIDGGRQFDPILTSVFLNNVITKHSLRQEPHDQTPTRHNAHNLG